MPPTAPEPLMRGSAATVSPGPGPRNDKAGARFPRRAAHPVSLPTGAFVVTLLTFIALLGFQLYVDNVFIITTNGLWKSVAVRAWADHADRATIDLANVLYFPVYGALTRLLDGLGIFPGLAWKQMAVLNAAFAAAILGGVYGWISSLFDDRRVGLLTVLFYMGSGHFLTLAVINEDIMPSYFVLLAALILAGLWFERPTPGRILAVAVMTSVAWLFEWRLMFPVLPPLLLALWLSANTWRQRLMRPLGFLLGMSILPLLVTVWAAVRQQLDPADAVAFFGRLFWVGKGVGTGWAGFSVAKLHLIWAGMAESVVGGRYLQSSDWMNHPANLWEVASATLLLTVLAVAAARYVWARRSDARLLAHGIVFGGTFLAGQFFNAYSQPQDPQMQLTVMPWIIPAWGVLMISLLQTRGPEAQPSAGHARRYGPLIAVLMSLFPMLNTVPVIAAERGGNTRYLQVLARLEQQLDPARTFFVYLGFDALIPWQFTNWSATWPNVDQLPPAPADQPKFKWLSITDGMIWHRDWTPEQQANELRRKIDHALSLGYRVVTNRLWELPERTWVETTVTIAAPETAIAIRRMLRETYQAETVYIDPAEGPFFELSLRMLP
ncbi:MAG: hypothetical protein MUF20_03405 [Methylotetracoccus sp.]|nr:hypothetical protein [Methylotetracoccus sp.]